MYAGPKRYKEKLSKFYETFFSEQQSAESSKPLNPSPPILRNDSQKIYSSFRSRCQIVAISRDRGRKVLLAFKVSVCFCLYVCVQTEVFEGYLLFEKMSIFFLSYGF